MVRQRSNCHNLPVIYFKGQSRTELNGNILKQVTFQMKNCCNYLRRKISISDNRK